MNPSTILISAALFAISLSAAAQMPAACKNGFDAEKLENHATAIASFTDCLNTPLIDAARAFVLQNRAKSYELAKQPAQALVDQLDSLKLGDPKDVWPLVMLSVYYRDLKRYDDALAALTHARSFDEDGPGTGPGMAVYYHTGRTFYEMTRYQDAIEALTKGIAKQPDYGWALYYRALCYESLGDKTQAKRDLFRVTELEPKEGWSPEIMAKLREYGFATRSKP